MDILIFILTCSFVNDDALIRSIINVQSSAYVYYVGDSSGAVFTAYPETLDEAKKALLYVRRNGGNALIGLMGVPSNLAMKYGYQPEELFDPCVNVKVGTAILSAMETTRPKGVSLRTHLSKNYGQLLGYSGNEFAKTVLLNITFLAKNNAKNSSSTTEVPNASNIFEDSKNNTENNAWNNNSIFMDDRITTNQTIKNKQNSEAQ